MSKRHPIDELFRQGLANSSASVPDDMWSRIAKNRQKKSRKNILFWSAISSLAVGLGILAWWTFDYTPQLGYFPLETEIAISSAMATTGPLMKKNSTANLTSTSLAPFSKPNTNNNTQTISAASSMDEALAIHTAPAPTLVTLVSSPVSSNERSEASNLNQVLEYTGINVPTTIEPVNNSQSALNKVSNSEPANRPSTNEGDNESSRVAGPHQRNRMGRVATLPSNLFKLTDQVDIKLFANHAPRCADFNSPFFYLDAEVLAGPAYAHQLLVAKTNENNGHLRQRQESEIADLSSSASLRLAATTHTGLGVRSGFSYTQINEQFTHQVGSKMDVSITFGPNGQVIGRDTTYTEAYEERSTNRLKFVEIPLLLGYEKKVGKLRIGFNAGAYLNLLFDAKGTVFSPATNEPIAFGQEGDRNSLPIFERRATAAWYGGLSLAYNLRSRYSILAEPFFKTYPRALSSTGYDLSQNYWMTGIQVGLRMRL